MNHNHISHRQLLTGAFFLVVLVLAGAFSYRYQVKKVYGSFENKAKIQEVLKKKRTSHRHPGFELQLIEEKYQGGEIPYGLASAWRAHDQRHQADVRRDNIFSEVVEIGPTSVGGRTRAIHIDPLNSDHILAGGVSGGIWTSQDRGFSWSVQNDKAANLTVTGFAYNPFNPAMIYYSTGEPRGGGGLGEGIFRSTDQGESFQQLPSSLNFSEFQYTWDIAHSLTDSLTVYICSYQGLYRTTDGGVSFEAVLREGSRDANDILVFEDGSVLAAIEGRGVYTSPDGSPNSFVQVPTPEFPQTFTRIKLAYCATQKNYVYAMLAVDISGEETPLIFSSSDYGLTWEQKATPITASTQRRYNMMLGVHPESPNRVVCGAVLSNYSNDGGDSWFFTGLSHSDYHEYTSFPDNPDEFLVGNDGGVHLHRWNNIFRVSARNTGYNVTQFYSGSYDPLEEHVIGGTQDNGTIRMKQGQFSYVFGADGGYAHVDQVESNRAYYSTQNSGLFRTNNWKQGIPIPTDIMYRPMADEGVSFINPYEMNYADGSQLYYRTNLGVWRTINRGSTWIRMHSDNLTEIRRLSLTDERDPYLYFAASSGGVRSIFRNTDASTTGSMEAILNLPDHPSLPQATTLNVAVHPNNQHRALVAYYHYTGTDDQVWYVDNMEDPDGAPVSVRGDLPENLPVNAIAFHPWSPDQTWIAATDFGLYYTTDGGDHWIKEDRVPNVQIYDLRIRKTDGAVFLYTYGRGNWVAYLEAPDIQVATLPASLDFDSGNWPAYARAHRTDPMARIKVFPSDDGYHVRLDMSADAVPQHTAFFDLSVDLPAWQPVRMAFDYFIPGEAPPAGSGIFISYDEGATYEQVYDFDEGGMYVWQQDSVTLTAPSEGTAILSFRYTGSLEFPGGGLAIDQIALERMPEITGLSTETLPELVLFPNPATSFLQLRSLRTYAIEQVRLIDILGKHLGTWQTGGRDDLRISLPSGLSGGYYILEFSDGKSIRGTRKIAIRNM